MPNKNPKILVLGRDGMVGHTVYNYLTKKYPGLVFGTSKKSGNKSIQFDFDSSTEKLFTGSTNEWNFVINCVGKLKESEKINYEINYTLPNKLDKLSLKYNFKLIHISTDDVFPYLSGNVNEKSKTYPENDYGKSKLKGETKSKNSITIRASFLGFSKNKKGLLEWVKNNKKKEIEGYINQSWSGCTSLQFARFCDYLIQKNNFEKLRKKTNIVHFTPIGRISKYLIIKSAVKILKNKTEVKETESELKIDRYLYSMYLSKDFLSKFGSNIDLSISNLYKFENK